jgi:hypothetical protein
VLKLANIRVKATNDEFDNREYDSYMGMKPIHISVHEPQKSFEPEASTGSLLYIMLYTAQNNSCK